MNIFKRIFGRMDDKSPVKTGCVYERKLTETEKLRRMVDVLVARLFTAELKNNKLAASESENSAEIEGLKRSLADEKAKNVKLSQKLSNYEDNELLEFLIS